MIDDGRFKRYRRVFEPRDPDGWVGPEVCLTVEDTATGKTLSRILPLWEIEMATFDIEELF